MTVGWMVYVLLVSVLVTLAAHAAAAALRLQGRPVRWVWTGALAVTAGAPLAPHVLPAVLGHLGPAAGGGGSAPAGTALLGAAAGAPGAGPEPALPLADLLATPVPGPLAAAGTVAWAVASLCLAAVLAGGWLRLRRRLESCPEARVAGVTVRVARETGPATAGILRPRVIVPAWLLRRPDPEVRMVVAHEGEHARARDPALIAVGRLAVALVPWNPCLWWLLGRLRLAVELDCDRRVLGRGHPRRDYGRLLLDVTAPRSAGLLHPATTLRESSSHLEARIRAMTDTPTPFSGLRTVLLVGACLGLVAAACETPVPPSAEDGARSDAEDVSASVRPPAGAATEEDRGDRPRWVPRDVDPRAENDDEIARLLDERYPDALRDRGVAGEVTLWLFVGEEGTVTSVRVQEPSRHDAFNEAAMEVARRMRFDPAVRDGEPVGVWIARTVRFRPDQAGGGAWDGEPADAAAGVVIEGERAAARLDPGEDGVEVSGNRPGAPSVRTRRLELGPADGAMRIRIRGDAPATPEDGPLIFVDGVRVEPSGDGDWLGADGSAPGRIRDLDPQDIESIEVIKGPPAVDRYGPEAESGVLLITTKRGSAASG